MHKNIKYKLFGRFIFIYRFIEDYEYMVKISIMMNNTLLAIVICISMYIYIYIILYKSSMDLTTLYFEKISINNVEVVNFPEQNNFCAQFYV